MRVRLIISILSILLLSCKQNQQDNNVLKPDYLSSWLIANEDSLYQEFVRYVNEYSYCKTCDSNWTEKAYLRVGNDSYMGRFSLEAKKYCDSIEVTYFYNKNSSPKCRILLSTGYNKRLTIALDTLLTYSFQLKHFKLEKYEQPEKKVDIFGIDEGNVVVKDLRIEMEPIDTLQNLTIFIYSKLKNTKITDDNKDFLKRSLFGEELLLKKINNVDFKITDTLYSDLMTLEQVRSKLN